MRHVIVITTVDDLSGTIRDTKLITQLVEALVEREVGKGNVYVQSRWNEKSAVQAVKDIFGAA